MARPSRKDASRKKVEEAKAQLRKQMGPVLATDFTHLYEKGYSYRIVNNEQGRIEKMMRKGWELVYAPGSIDGIFRPDADKSTQETSIVRIPVGSLKTVDAGEGILMRIDNDTFKALCEIQEERRNDLDRALKGGAAGADGDEVKGVETYAAATSKGGRGFEVQTEN